MPNWCPFGRMASALKKTVPTPFCRRDTKDGHFWLVSRVFIFTVFLQAMRCVKCVVFVETRDEQYRRLIGTASPDAVRTALAGEYPWLEKALSAGMIKRKTSFLNPSLSPEEAGKIIEEFIVQPEMRSNEIPSLYDKWTQLGTKNIWEHTEWLTRETVDKYRLPAVARRDKVNPI